MKCFAHKPAFVALLAIVLANADQPVAADQQGDSMDKKLDAYIKCYNCIDERALRCSSRYKSWVKDMKAGPSSREILVYGLYQLDSETIGECKQSFREAAALKPTTPLDAVATTYIHALDASNQAMEEDG